MARILVYLDHVQNRHLLVEWLRGQHRVLLPQGGDRLADPCDLVIVDGPALGRLHREVRARKLDEMPLLLPVLLVTPRREAGLAPRQLWETVDEIIATPIDKAEFDARLRVLLRGRQLSVDLKLANDARLYRLARHDALTDLPNRALLVERLESAFHRAAVTRQRLAVLFLDLDRFKGINESWGYAIGDLLLRAIGERLQACMGAGETVARLGGDEFALVTAAVGWGEDAVAVAGKLLAALSRPFEIGGRSLYASASIGIAVYPDDATEAESLLRQAETAMYRAKERGGNAWRFYKESMQERVQERLGVETALREGLENGGFVLHYQPKVEVASGLVLGVEALLRLNHPERGFMQPADFIPVAEETGLIVPIGAWALRTACTQYGAWARAGLVVPPIAVNLSVRQFNDEVEGMVEKALADSGMPPRALELEITESGIMQDAEASIQILRSLHRLGIGFSIDDFGTGYSSMSYLKRLPVSVLKIDQSFVRDLEEDGDSRSIVRAIIGLAHNLKLNVVAEGVETPGQLACLRREGCEAAQGYLFSRPLPPDDCARFFPLAQKVAAG